MGGWLAACYLPHEQDSDGGRGDAGDAAGLADGERADAPAVRGPRWLGGHGGDRGARSRSGRLLRHFVTVPYRVRMTGTGDACVAPTQPVAVGGPGAGGRSRDL